jgi:hypothetical protein
MGGTNSTLQGSSVGYHVLEATGPAKAAGLELFFDYITHINGIRVEPNSKFDILIKQSAGKAIGMVVYSSKTTKLRNLSIVPTEQGIGVKCKVCDFERAHERVWHVLEVQSESPAHYAGLRSNTDYILGCTLVILHEKDDFGNLISQNQGQELEFVVYNSDMDTLRNVFFVHVGQNCTQSRLGWFRFIRL